MCLQKILQQAKYCNIQNQSFDRPFDITRQKLGLGGDKAGGGIVGGGVTPWRRNRQWWEGRGTKHYHTPDFPDMSFLCFIFVLEH